MGILEREMKRLAQQAGGAHKTVSDRMAQGMDKRTLQNEMAMIRVVLRQAGRVKLADSDRISNRAVGISGASRNGTRRAITDGKYQAVQESARLKDPGLAAALELARLMGLRSQEAVRCPQSFSKWKQALDNAIGIAEQHNGRLIDRATLKEAMQFWRRQAERLGLTGQNSPHSLRYAWAQMLFAIIWRRDSVNRRRWR
ncbi:DNA-binding protein [Salmonella enterica]|nr:DNA-binding protein [Salmonella enterica]